MKINTIENCINIYKNSNEWGKEFDDGRINSLLSFPYSIIVEGDILEIDMALYWCTQNLGPADITNEIPRFRIYSSFDKYIGMDTGAIENGNWKSVFYGKTDYDYGFFEFYFKKKESLERFIEFIPTFFAYGPNNKKWKTDGGGKIIDL